MNAQTLPRPAVSVIMPAYRAADTLPASIASLQGQTLKDWECIIINDGSPDETGAVAEALSTADPRITVLHTRNNGPSSARNLGIRHARAAVLAFLDADDFWAPERLDGMLDTLASHPSAGVLFSRTRFLDAQTLKKGTLSPFIEHLTPDRLMAENAVCSTSNIVSRRAVFDDIGGFIEGLNHAEDQEWLLRVVLDGRWRVRGVNREWFYYRSAPDSQSADLTAMRQGWFDLVRLAESQFPGKAAIAADKAYGPIHRQLARRALRMGQPATALSYLRKALSRDPLLIAREPRRTVFTLIGTALAFIPSATLREIIAK